MNTQRTQLFLGTRGEFQTKYGPPPPLLFIALISSVNYGFFKRTVVIMSDLHRYPYNPCLKDIIVFPAYKVFISQYYVNCFCTRNPQVILVIWEPTIEKYKILKLKTWISHSVNIIQSFKGYRCESINPLYRWRIT